MLFKERPLASIFLVIISAAFLIRVINLNYNSAFLDEATYIVLGKKILAGHFREVAGSVSWVGGLPFLYPPLSAIFFSMGGILGSRFLNVFLGTFAVFLIYYLAKSLSIFKEEEDNKIVGLLASSFLATSTIPIAFSRLAIYDILSFTIFLLALVAFSKAIFKGERSWYIACALIFFLSFLAKYIVVIFFPLLLVLPLYLAAKTKDMEKIKGIFTYFWLPLILPLILYFGLNFSSLSEFILSQTQERSPAIEILRTFWNFSWIAYVLSLGGIVFFFKEKHGFFIGLLFIISLIPLIFHILTGNNLSSHQHSFLSLIFVLPIVGAFLTFIIKKYAKVGIAVSLILVIFNLVNSIPKVYALGSFWPNTKGATDLIQEKVSRDDRILAESGDVVTLALYDKVPPENVYGPFVFSYKDQDGLSAYLLAISDGYFNFIQLDEGSFSPESISEMKRVIGERYSLIFVDGKLRIFQLES